MTAPLHFVTATHLARELGTSRHTVAKHAREAGVREAGGKWDPEPAKVAVLAGLDLDKAQGHWLVGRGERMGAAPVSGLTAARERQALATAETREIANAERRKLLVERAAVVAQGADFVVRIRSAMSSVPGKAAPEVAKESDPERCKQILERHVDAALVALATCDDIHKALLR